MSLSSERQHLSVNQISSTYLNPLPRYKYFLFKKTTVRHIGVLFPVSIPTISAQSGCQSAPVYQISSKLLRPWLRNDIISIFKIAEMGPIMGSLKSTFRTSYRSSIGTIALNCFYVFMYAFWATDGQTNRRTALTH